MKISCKIAEDLLPLYLDGSCSEDSRAALEEHLEECPACRAARDRMQSGITDGIRVEPSAPQLASYAKKVRRHRIRLAAMAVLVVILASAILALVGLTIEDMYRQAFPVIYQVEPGTCNLTAGELKTTAEELEQYVFYTNYTEIKVEVQGEGSFQGTVMLWNVEDSGVFIQIHKVNEKEAVCTFTGLSAANRYRITCDNLEGAAVTVSDGRTVSFWHSLKSVLNIGG